MNDVVFVYLLVSFACLLLFLSQFGPTLGDISFYGLGKTLLIWLLLFVTCPLMPVGVISTLIYLAGFYAYQSIKKRR